jgi:DivIVA domain-containing protein
VRNKQFATVRFKEGYDLDEVDKFLDDVEAEIIRLTTENEELRARATTAETAPKPSVAPVTAPVAPPVPAAQVIPPTEAAVAMLTLAQKTADEHVANAKMESERVLSQARNQADAAMVERETQRVTLEKRIEELRAFEREYRSKLRSYIEGQLQDLDTRSGESAALRPATPAAPVHPATTAQVPAPPAPVPAAPTPPRPAAPPVPPAPPAGGDGFNRPVPVPPTAPPVPPTAPPVPPPFGGTIPTAPPREG